MESENTQTTEQEQQSTIATSSPSETTTANTSTTVAADPKNPFPLISQFTVKQEALQNVDLDSLSDDERASLKLTLEEECLQICNCYLSVLAVIERWEKYSEIRIANDADIDDLFDENNGKLKSKLKIILLMAIGAGLAYYFEQSWIWFAFQILSLGPHMYDAFTRKEEYDTIVIPDKEAYFGQNFVSLGFKVQGKGRVSEKDKSLQPNAIELYNYFKHTQAIIKSLAKPSAKKLKKD